MTPLDQSRHAWQEALLGMKVSKPTYKVSLILVVLDAIDGARATADAIPVRQSLSEAFDLLLSRHHALDGPGRWRLPGQYLAVRSGSQPDQLWQRVDDRLEVEPAFQEVLADPQARTWLRGEILKWLKNRVDEPSKSLALLMERDLGENERQFEVDRLEDIWGWWRAQETAISAQQLQQHFPLLPYAELISAAHTLEQMGLIVADANLVWKHEIGSLTTGLALTQQLVEGDTSMKLLDTTAKRRQGQQAWRNRVLANFGGVCAVCPIGVPQILEGAHLLPVKDFQERGLALDNGLCLCRNHHRAMDESMLAIDGRNILHHFTKETGHGLAQSLRSKAVIPQMGLAADALAYRLEQFAGRYSSPQER